jgi:hypothetical protein
MSKWLSILIVLASSALTLSAETAPAGKNGRDVYIVRLASPSLARTLGSGGGRKLDAGSPASRQVVERLLREQGEVLAAARGRIGRDVAAVQQYVHVFNGMTLELTREEADRISRLPGVAGVQRRRVLRPQSDAGPAWAGATGIWDGTQTGGLPGTKGEGMVIGVVDSGINMDHPSFADVGGDGYNHTNPRGAGNYIGWCNPSNPNYSPSYPCNDKLIGVWSFAYYGNPEDDNGHGTQVASVAAGNQLAVALTGTLNRTISGVAPHANLIAYDICDYYCYSDYAVAAIDQAVADGVDVLTLAFSADNYDGPWVDFMALALLDAREAGVFVAAPAGNDGYWGSYNIGSTASSPWLLTVGASTHNRRFSSTLTGMTGGSTTPPSTLPSVTFTDGFGPAPIVDAASYGNSGCYYSFAPSSLAGKIVVCTISYYSDGVAEVANAKAAGAGGVVLANYYDYSDTVIEPVYYGSPVVHLYAYEGYDLRNWLATGSGHMARISATVVDIAALNGDILAFFSSRGPGDIADVIKPDVLAPGVQILSASSDPLDYAIQSGTSHASAFAAGSAALLMALHPSWTVAEVQSALVTTAKASIQDTDGTAAISPFEIGAGRLDLSAAGRAGLVLDETGAHFEQADPDLNGVPSALNLGSLAQNFCTLSCSWTRTVRSTLSTTSTWTASITPPIGTAGSVVPSSFTLAPGATQTIQINLSGPPSAIDWIFGSLTLSENASQAPPARLQIATRWVAQRKLTVSKSGAGSGVVTSSPAGIDCGPTCVAPFPDGTTATLTATPSPGSAFVGWNGGSCYYGNGPCTISFYGDRQITAYFDVQPPDRPLANRVGFKDGMNPPVSEGTWRYYFVDIPAGTGELVVDLLDLSGNVTLFVRQNDKPDASHYNCYDSGYYGFRNRRCVVSTPAAGRWWIGVRNEDTGTLLYSVRASWGSATDQALANGVPLGDFVSNSQPGAAWKYYYVDLSGENSELVVDLRNLSADADLYVRHGAKPDRTNYDCVSAAASTVAERCTMPQPETGLWWIAVNNFSAGTVTYDVQAAWTAAAGADFHTVEPCRLVDTRTSYPLQASQSRSFLVAGSCGIPTTARALALNVTVLDATGKGFLTLYPDNLSVPIASTINFQVGVTRANNATVRLSTDGEGRVGVYSAVSEGGVVNLILDVAGYYE